MSLPTMYDIIDPELKFVFEEDSSGVVDGVNVLGKVRGQFFVPNGISRNNRFYSKALWEKALAREDVQEKMKSNLMFGSIGHDALINDKGIRDGMVSHYISEAYIDAATGKGMGVAYILNTPTGKILNTLLRAKCKMRVSSRADGEYNGTTNGIPNVSEDHYRLHGWDFVVDAGFLQAAPELSEALTELNKINNLQENKMAEPKTMDEKLVQKVLDENAEVKNKNVELQKLVESAEADKEAAEKENDALKDQADAKDKELKDKSEKLAKYEAMGEPEDIEKMKADKEAADKKVEDQEKELNQYKELGDSPEDIKESLELAVNEMETLKTEFGSVTKIREALNEAKTFRESVNALGTIEQITEAVTKAKQLQEELDAKAQDEKAEKLAAELGIDVAKVKEWLAAGKSEDDIKKMHSEVTEAIKKANPAAKSVLESKAPVKLTEDKNKIDEGVPASFKTSRLDRMIAGT